MLIVALLHIAQMYRFASLDLYITVFDVEQAAFADTISGRDPSDCFEEVIHALRGNQFSLPNFIMPGLSSRIQFDTSTGEFEIKWHDAGSTQAIMKILLVFEKSEPSVIRFRLALAHQFR
jgi:hypothetical protein